MAHENIPHKVKYKLFHKAYKTSALLDSFVVISCNDIKDTRYVHWGSKNLNFMNSLRVWHCQDLDKNDTQVGRLRCPVHVCWVHTWSHWRYLQNVGPEDTGGVHVLRDVIWLRQMFYKAKTSTNYVEVNVEPEQEIHKAIEADEDEEESSNKSSKSSKIEEETQSVNQDEDTADTPQDIQDNDQPEPEEPPVTRTRSGLPIQ
jgi:hypothetical protein